MYLLINDEYGQEIAAVQYDEEKEKLKDVFDAARVKYPHNAFCVSSSSATMPEPAAPELTDLRPLKQIRIKSWARKKLLLVSLAQSFRARAFSPRSNKRGQEYDYMG